MQPSLLVDAHLDLAFNVVGGLDPRMQLDQARATEWGQVHTQLAMTLMVTLPELHAARNAVIFGTLFVMPQGAPTDIPGTSYATADEAHAQAQAQLRCYRELARTGEITLLQSRSDLQTHLALLDGSATESPIGLVPLMEGADPIREPGEVEAWYGEGVRLVGPAWGATRYSGGTNAPGPLTPLGRELMREMQRVGMVLDVSHMAEESFWEALDLYNGPVCASHANCRTFVPTDRQLSDDMIRALIDRDAVIGAVLYNRFLHPQWERGDPKEVVDLSSVVQHIEHICELAGDTLHVGIGSDLDGGIGLEGCPVPLTRYRDVPRIGQALRDAGWSVDEVDGVLGGNWLRWLDRALP